MATQLHSAWTDERGQFEFASQGLVRARHYSRSIVAKTIAGFWGTM